jgi:hypothetical protein
MQRGETTSGVPWALLAAVFMTLPACSADVDGYRVREDVGGLHQDGGDETGGSDGLGGGAGTGGAPGGGRSGSGGHATGTGATSNGGAFALGAGGGKGGTSGDGGSGNGGSQASGGRGAGGSGAGGAGTGGAGPIGIPTDVTPASAPDDITAAAWNGSHFFLLQATTGKFFAIDPEVPSISDAMPLPSGQVAPLAFGASATSVYAVIDGKVFMVPMTGAIGTETGAGGGIVNSAVGAYAAGTFLLGATGTTALQYTDIGGSVAPVPALGAIYAVATDGVGFAFTTTTADKTTVEVSQALPGSLAPNATRCARGNFTTRDDPVSVFGSTVAFVRQGSAKALLAFGPVTAGKCEVVHEVTIGASSTVAKAVGLIDADDALVVDDYSGTTGHITIMASDGTPLAAKRNVDFGVGGGPQSFVVGGRHAVLVTGKTPVLLSF